MCTSSSDVRKNVNGFIAEKSCLHANFILQIAKLINSAWNMYTKMQSEFSRKELLAKILKRKLVNVRNTTKYSN